MSRNEWTDEKLFFRLLNNRTKKTYWANISALRKRPTENVFKKSVELTNSENPKEREIGIHVLSQLGAIPRPFSKESIRLFFDLLESEKEPIVVMSLLYAIGHNNDNISKLHIDKLCSFKDTTDDLVKEGLIFSLLGIDRLNAIEILIRLSSDRLCHIRNWATFGIGSLIEKDNNAIRTALWARVNDKHQDTKLEAIVGLAIRKDLRVKDIIKRELVSGEYGTLLFDAIIELNEEDILPILKACYQTEMKNENINPDWLDDMKQCIQELTEKIKTNA